MDTVKQGRAKVSEGDCVSVPNDYFGADYLVSLQTVGVTEDSPYGRVVRLINGNQLSDVKWDVEGDESKTSLNSVSIEARDTPIQQPNPFDKQVFNSSTATTSHALLEEKDLDVSPQPNSFDASSILFVISNAQFERIVCWQPRFPILELSITKRWDPTRESFS